MSFIIAVFSPDVGAYVEDIVEMAIREHKIGRATDRQCHSTEGRLTSSSHDSILSAKPHTTKVFHGASEKLEKIMKSNLIRVEVRLRLFSKWNG